MKLLQENEQLNNRVVYLEKRIEELELVIDSLLEEIDAQKEYTKHLELTLEEHTKYDVLGADIL